VLNNRYDTVVVGKNYISLIFSIITARKKKSVLVIDEPDVTLGNKWYLNIGTLEKSLLESFGEHYHISVLEQLDQYLSPINTIICLNEKLIELGSSPFSNIRELARKIPELFTVQFIEALSELDSESFDRECIGHFSRLANKVMDKGNITENMMKISDSDLHQVYQNFQDIINNTDDLMTEQLHFVLQVLYQTIFSNSKNNLETSYLLSAILSPRFTVNESKLSDDLVFLFKKMGGDIKSTRIQDWEIYRDKLSYILLESFEGVIHLNDLYFFGRLPNKVPFENKREETLFHGIDLKVPINHGFMDYYKNKRILFSRSEHLGTSSPHWEVHIDDAGILHATYSYADFQGTKPSFHYKKAAQDVYESVAELLPGLSLDDWMHQVQYEKSRDLWMEFLSSKKNVGHFSRLKDSVLQHKENDNKIDQLYYWGPLKARSLGMFSYLVDLKSSQL
jgi:hypothetical protein